MSGIDVVTEAVWFGFVSSSRLLGHCIVTLLRGSFVCFGRSFGGLALMSILAVMSFFDVG